MKKPYGYWGGDKKVSKRVKMGRSIDHVFPLKETEGKGMRLI